MKAIRTMGGALLATVLIWIVAAPAAHAQIPVVDMSALAQQVRQVAAWAEQYQQMARQIDYQVRQIEAITGGRGFGGLLNGPGQMQARRMLPPEMRQILDLYNGTVVPGYGALSQLIAALRAQISTLPPGYFEQGSILERELNAAMDKIATERVLAEQAYSAVTQRTGDTEQLMGAIGATNDAKGIAELQARIQAEQVLATNEANRIALMQYQQAIQHQQAERRAAQEMSRAFRDAQIGGLSFSEGETQP